MNGAPSSTVDRIPPNNLEAEMALLGSVLVDREMMDVVAEIVQPADFYASLHETIFVALHALHQRGEPLDKVALAEELRGRGMLDKIGGLGYLGSLMDTVPSAASAEHYALIVRHKAILRALIHAGTHITALGYESEHDVAQALIEAERALASVTERDTEAARMPEPGIVMDRLVDRLLRHEEVRLIRSPWPALDDIVGGFTAGELVAIVAAAKVGKTGLAMTLGEYIAETSGPCVFHATEMGDEALERRRLALRSGVPARRQRIGDVGDADLQRIVQARNALRGKPYVIAGREHRTLRSFWRVARYERDRLGPLAAIIVDHVGFVAEARAFGRDQTETQALDTVYRTLLDLAVDFDCPVFVVVHPNRDGATERPSRGTLQKIRGGGALENHAHTIICPWRADPVTKPHDAEVIVVASRDGGEGAIPFHYEGARAGWYEMRNGVVLPLWFEAHAPQRQTEMLPLARGEPRRPLPVDDADEDELDPSALFGDS